MITSNPDIKNVYFVPSAMQTFLCWVKIKTNIFRLTSLVENLLVVPLVQLLNHDFVKKSIYEP